MVKREIKLKWTGKEFGIDLLESISKGIYEDPLYVIREYVQNSFDADAKEIRITLTNSKLTIWDNGKGMDKNEVVDLKKIGIGRKPIEKVGFRGIGFWSGLAIGKKIKIRTGMKGKKKEYFLTINAEGIKKEFGSGKPAIDVLKENLKLTENSKVEGKKGTEIEIYVEEPFLKKLEDDDKVREFLGMTLPVDFPDKFKYGVNINEYLRKNISKNIFRMCKILYNGRQFLKPIVKNLVSPIFYTLSKDGKEYGFMWVLFNKKTKAITNENVAGLIFKVKNFSIGDRNKWSILFPRARPKGYEWFTGEVHITNPNIIPDASRTDFEYSPEREILYDLIKGILSGINTDYGKRSKQITAEDKSKKALEQLQDIEKSLPKLDGVERVAKIPELNEILDTFKTRKKDIVSPQLDLQVDAAEKKTSELISNLIKEKRGVSKKEVKKAEFKEKIKAFKDHKKIADKIKDLDLDKKEKILLKNILNILKTNLDEDLFFKVAIEIFNFLNK